MKTQISYVIAFITGLFLIFIGARFLLAPDVAETAYGLHFNENGDYSFHYIKGCRDLFSGILLCALVFGRQQRALAITLLAATMVPLTDCIIVLSKPYNGLVNAIPHLTAIIICVVVGGLLLAHKRIVKEG